MRNNDDAVSTVVGVMLIIFLVVALSAVMYIIFFGLVFPVEKTAYVVTEAEMVNTSSGVVVISLRHLNGDVMQYENLTPNPPYEAQFMVETGDGVFPVMTVASLLSDVTWSPGNTVFFFRNVSGYYLTDDITRISAAIRFPPGPITIRVIDNTHHQLVANPSAGSWTGGLASVTPTAVATTLPPTPVPTTTPTTIATTLPPTPVPTTTPPPSQYCVSCGTGESFSVSFTTQVLGTRQIRFKDATSPQPNLRAWTFGDGGSGSGELVVHTFPAAGSYLITLTVKKNNSPCTCTLSQWIIVS